MLFLLFTNIVRDWWERTEEIGMSYIEKNVFYPTFKLLVSVIQHSEILKRLSYRIFAYSFEFL